MIRLPDTWRGLLWLAALGGALHVAAGALLALVRGSSALEALRQSRDDALLTAAFVVAALLAELVTRLARRRSRRRPAPTTPAVGRGAKS